MRATKPRITERKNPGGSVSYCVDAGLVDGKRPRKFFSDKNSAKDYAKKLQSAKKSQGELVFSLTHHQQIEAAEAYKALKLFDVSLSDAIAYFLRHAQPKAGKITVAALKEEFLQVKTKANKKPRYLKELRCKLKRFAATFGEMFINEINRAKFEEWLDAQTFAPLTKVNYLRDLGMLWTFAVKRGHCAENIVLLVEKPAVQEKPVEIFTIAEIVRLLFAAHIQEPKLVPYISIGLFAGLRSCELEQLDWDDINVNSRNIEVKAEKSKTGRRRIVEISDNLSEWLKPHQKISGPVVSRCWREKLQALVKFAEFERWPSNVLRHSFGSYHFARHQDASKTAAKMGHSTPKMLFHHYRELVQPQDAERYWNILPPKGFMMLPPEAKKQAITEAQKQRLKDVLKDIGLAA